MTWNRATARLSLSLLYLTIFLSGGHLEAAFPGANGGIAFSSVTAGDADIYTMSPDGSGLTRLTRSRIDEFEPAWSANGKRLAYTSGGQVYLMNADGTHKVNVSNSAG